MLNSGRLQVSASGLYTYPDVMAVCGEPRFLDAGRDTLLNPSLIVEVLSPSTEAYDRGRKFESYRSIESLREYLLLTTDHFYAELFTRRPDGTWSYTPYSIPGDTIQLSSIDARLTLSDLYDKVEFS